MYVLKNEKCVGDLTQCKRYVADYLTKEFRRNKGEQPFIHIRNHHEGIISREIWDETQKQIEQRGEQSRKGHKHSIKYWFSGKLRCGCCGKSYIVSGGRTKATRMLRCHNRQVYGNNLRELNGFTVGCDNETINQVSMNECMRFLLEHIKSARESIVSDLFAEIKRMQVIDNKHFDSKPLEIKI
jgi:hypothetical protein